MYSSPTKSRIKLPSTYKYKNNIVATPKFKKRVSPLTKYNSTLNSSKISERMIVIGLGFSIVCLGLIFAPLIMTSSSKPVNAEAPSMRIVTNFLNENNTNTHPR